MKDNNCSIIQDLLPSYIDKLTSEETSKKMEEHLKDCEDCRRMYEDMSSGEASLENESKNEINYLKKINHKTVRIIVSVLLTAVILIAIPFVKYCFIGTTRGDYTISLEVSGSRVSGEVSLIGSATSVSSIKFDEDNGVVIIKVYSVLPLMKGRANANSDFEYIAREKSIKKVMTSGGDVLWEDYVDISDTANRIFKHRAKYVGRASDVNDLLYSIDAFSELQCNNVSLHLITDNKPYGLEIYDFTTAFDGKDEYFNQAIKECAFILLASIENLDYVRFDYHAPSGTHNDYKLTAEEADKRLGYDIKAKASTVIGMQSLLDDIKGVTLFSDALEYAPCFEETSIEALNKLNDNPIDKKHLAKLGTGKSISEENKIYSEWIGAYEKQYKVIYEALSKYASKSDYFAENLEPLRDGYKGCDDIATLCYTVEQEAVGWGTGTGLIYQKQYLYSLRTKTLQLAEFAYRLDIQFEWVE